MLRVCAQKLGFQTKAVSDYVSISLFTATISDIYTVVQRGFVHGKAGVSLSYLWNVLMTVKASTRGDKLHTTV